MSQTLMNPPLIGAQAPASLYLRESDRAKIAVLVRRLLPNVSAWAYGSRVNGNAHEASDLDLALRTPNLEPIAAEALTQFKLALQDSHIPILVDVRDWACLPHPFQAEIARQYVVLVD